MSDRRVVKMLKLFAASAFLDGRDAPDASDFFVLKHIWNSEDQAPIIEAIVQPELEAFYREHPERRRVGAMSVGIEALASEIDRIRHVLTGGNVLGDVQLFSQLSALNEIKDESTKIITVEDPVEYQQPGISQIQTHAKIGLTFAHALRSILRHDPDVVLIGEMRDLETAESAIQASLTGHLVFSTLHTNDAPSAITRLVDIGVQPFLVASSVIAIMAQRLVRVNCVKCKAPDQPSAEEIRNAGLTPEKLKNATFMRGQGCNHCNHTGYRGRSAIHELLDMSDLIREMIIERRPGSEIRRQAEKEGLSSLRESAVKKVFSGQTTLHEINRVTFVEEIKQ